MLTHDLLLDLFVVLGPGCNSRLLWHVPHRLATRGVSPLETTLRNLHLFSCSQTTESR